MKTKSFFVVWLLASLATGCENASDNNRGMSFDTLDVHFEGALPDMSWKAGSEVGIFSACTRGNTRDTPMSIHANARYRTATDGESALLRRLSDDDAIVADAADHNFRFHAYFPYSAAATDAKRLAAAVPAEQPYVAGTDYGTYVASKRVTTVVPTVKLEFRNLFATMELYLPDDLLGEEAPSVVRSMTLRPAEAANFSGALVVSGRCDLTTGTFTEDPASRSQQIDVDFGEQGLELKESYTRVPLTVAPLTVPEGGFELLFRDMHGKESTLKILAKEEDAGTVLAAGEVTTQYLSGSDDGVIPVTFPVEFPLGVDVFNATTQPQWNTSGLWICPDQPQATAQWNKVSDPSEAYTQKLEYVASNIGSPGIKGIWTGDHFEFTLPVRKFAAGTSVTVRFPMYTRQGPVFWNIEYLDGTQWKCNKTTIACYDPKYSMEATYSLIRGGKVIEHTMTFEHGIESGLLKIRLTCADGSIQADTNTTVAVRSTPWVSGSAYGAPFYLYLKDSDVTSVTFSLN